MKPTDLWGVWPTEWKIRPPCRNRVSKRIETDEHGIDWRIDENGNRCHHAAPRSTTKQGVLAKLLIVSSSTSGSGSTIMIDSSSSCNCPCALRISFSVLCNLRIDSMYSSSSRVGHGVCLCDDRYILKGCFEMAFSHAILTSLDSS